MKTPLALFVVCCLLVAGCSPKAETPAPASEKPTASKDTPPTGTEPSKEPAPEAPKPAPELSAELKHAGYEYYGLSNSKPQKMELKDSGSSGVRTGTHSIEFVKMDGENAIYKLKRTDDLEFLGDMELRLTKEGIYATKIQGNDVKPANLELPADVTPGKSWKTGWKTEVGGQAVEKNGTTKIVGVQAVKVKDKTYQAMVMTDVGTAKIDGKNTKVETKVWMVKGVGPVKMEVKSSSDAGSRTLTFEATQ